MEVGDHGVGLAKLRFDTLLDRSGERRLVGGGGDVLHLRGVEEALRLGDPAIKGIDRDALVLPSEGGPSAGGQPWPVGGGGAWRIGGSKP
jgi:hypothetical protein